MADAIRRVETAAFTKETCHTARGKSGEIGCYQYLPSTWELYSREVLGYVAPQGYINDTYVTVVKVEGWLSKGYTPYQIALLWNGGELEEKRGVNKHGEEYDTARYARRVLAALNE